MESCLSRMAGVIWFSELVTWEIGAFFRACTLGMLLALEYDCIRIFRRVIKHRHIWLMSVEDILYWISVSIIIFGFTYEYSDGILRGFLVLSILLGVVLYRYTFGIYFVKYTSAAINFLLKPLKKVVAFIKLRVVRVWRGLCMVHLKRVKGDKNELQKVEKKI